MGVARRAIAGWPPARRGRRGVGTVRGDDVVHEQDAALVRLVHAAAHAHRPGVAQVGGARLQRLGEDRQGHAAVDHIERGEGHAVAALGGLLAHPAERAEQGQRGRPPGARRGRPPTPRRDAGRRRGSARADAPRGRSRAPPSRRRGAARPAIPGRSLPPPPGAGPRRRAAAEPVEQRPLPLGAGALGALAALHGLVEGGEESGPGPAERVEGPRLDQALDDPPVDQPQVGAVAEVGESGERPRLLARAHHRLDGPGANVLDGGEAEADGAVGHGEVARANG